MTSPKQHPASNSDARKRAEETALGAEYAASLGLHLSVDEQRARFKRSTEGAPLVQRPLRRQPVPECVVSADERPPDRAKVDAAIRKLAATGEVFSANDARDLHGVAGPVVGAAFTAARRAGLIKSVGFVTSTDPGTHAHPVRTWVAA